MKKKIFLGVITASMLNAIEPSAYVCNTGLAGNMLDGMLNIDMSAHILNLKPSGRVVVYTPTTRGKLIEIANGEWQDRDDEALVIYKQDILRYEDGEYRYKGMPCIKESFTKVKEFYRKKGIEFLKKYNSTEEVKKRKIAAEKNYRKDVKNYSEGYKTAWQTVKIIPEQSRDMMLNELILDDYNKLSENMKKDIRIYLTEQKTFIPGINASNKKVNASDKLKNIEISDEDIKKVQRKVDEYANMYNNPETSGIAGMMILGDFNSIRNDKKKKAIIEGLNKKNIFIKGINK